MKHWAIRLTGLIAAIGMAGIVPACAATNRCMSALPTAAVELLATSYPNYRIVQLSDLNADDQDLWKNSYSETCPGVVQGTFTGKQAEYAVLLVPVKQGEQEIRAVLLGPKEGGGMTQRQIFAERRVGNLPVIRRSEPGAYEDVQKHTELKAANDVILIEHLESKVTAIAFLQSNIQTLTIAD